MGLVSNRHKGSIFLPLSEKLSAPFREEGKSHRKSHIAPSKNQVLDRGTPHGG